MDASDDGDCFQCPHVVVVPSVQRVCSCQKPQAKCRCCSSSATAHSPIRSPTRCSTNYLLKGGGRAAEKAAVARAAKNDAAAWKYLKVSNHALASELVRMTTNGSKEKQSLQEEVAKLELLVQAQQDKLELLQGRLADAVKHDEVAQERHQARLKEVVRRLKEEEAEKTKALQELNRKLATELQAKQQDSEQLPALHEQLTLVTHKLELESSGRAELWHHCSVLEQELQSTQDKLAAATKSLRRAEQQLDRGARIEQKLAKIQEALQAEQVAHSQLQADVALERSQATAIKVELEQAHHELAALRPRYEHTEQQRSMLSLSLADAQAAAADAAVEVRAATARADRLQQELELTRSEADSQATSLRSQAAAREERLTAQHACRLAQLQSELDAQAASASDTEAALATARAKVDHLTAQVESLRQLGDAAGSQLGTTTARLEQLQADKEQQEQQLRAQLQVVQVQLLQREAELAEAVSAADSSGKAWKQEQGRLTDTANKWREKALQLQDELERKQSEAVAASKAHAQEVAKLQTSLDNATADLADTRSQLAAVDAERTAAAKRSSTLMTQWEERDASRDEELSKLRSQVSELLSSGNSARCEADELRQQLKTQALDVEHMTLALADEQSRLAALRSQLGALEKERAGECEERTRGMQELTAALQAEQQARLEAQLELNRQEKKVAGLEAELQQQRGAMHQVLEAKSKAEEAAATSAAALTAAERKAKQYRGDSTALLSDYDAWVQNLLSKKSNSGSGGAASAPISPGIGRMSLSLAHSGAGAAADLGGWAVGGTQSPIREGGGLSRSNSQSGLASAAKPSPGQGTMRDELERYDRIASLLESRVSASLTRSLSGKMASPGAAASSVPLSPGLVERVSSSNGRVSGLSAARSVFK